MSDIIVVSGSSDREQSRRYEESCARHGVPLSIIKVDGSMEGVQIASQFLLQRPEKYAVISCAFDVLVSRWSEAEIIRWIDLSGGLLMSCEADCWPAGDYCAAYTDHSTPWYAINGGQLCGERLKVVQLLNVIYSRADSTTRGGSSQEILHMLHAESYPMTLDNKCRVFQSMSGISSQYVVPRERRAYNTVTETHPMFMHFNGRTPGADEWEKALA